MFAQWAFRGLVMALHARNSTLEHALRARYCRFWALLNGVLGTLLALLGVIGGALGILWGWKSHRAKMKTLKLEQKALEIARLRAAAP